MMKFLSVQKSLLSAWGVVLAYLSTTWSLQGQVVFDAEVNGLNSIENGVSGTSVQAVGGGGLVQTSTGVTNYNWGFASAGDIDSLLGRPLLETETVRLSLTIDSLIGDVWANGLEFGISPNGTALRPNGNLIYQIRPDGAEGSVASNGLDGGGASGFGVVESSMLDGFSAELVASRFGYTFTLSDVLLSTGTEAVYHGSFSSPAEFRDAMGGGHFYFTCQKNELPNPMVIQFSEAVVEVSIPPPVSLPTNFTHQVSLGSTSYTAHFTLHSARGDNFAVLIQQADGSFTNYTPGPVRTYMGELPARPGAMASAVRREDGSIYYQVLFEDGAQWIDWNRGSTILRTNTVEPQFPTHVVGAGGAGFTDSGGRSWRRFAVWPNSFSIQLQRTRWR